MRDLYSELRTQIESETSVTHVRLWNNQIELIDKGEQIPFQFPAVFIDFPDINWAQRGNGTQTTDLTIRFYICFESFHTSENEEDLDVFTLRDSVYLALQDFKPTSAGKLMRTREETDPRHTNVYVWIMDFVSSYQDTVAQNPRNSTIGSIATLILTKDLQIDADTVDGIRTDFEFPE